MPNNINLQLATDETTPVKKEETNLDNKTEVKSEFGNSIRNAFGLNDKETTKPTPKEAAKTPDKVEVKAEDVKPIVDETKIAEQKEQEYDEILYNKEKVKIPVAERQTYLQKGYNYDKVKTAADTANATLQRVAKAEGFKSVDEYLTELTNKENANRAEEIQEADGDPEKIDSIINNHPKVLETLEKEKKMAFKEAKDVLRKDRFFKELEPEFDELMGKNPTAQPDLVYKVLVGNYVMSGKFSELLTKEKASTEKTVLANMHDAERRTVPKGGDTDDGKETVQQTELGSKLAGVYGLSKSEAQKAAYRSHEKLKNGR